MKSARSNIFHQGQDVLIRNAAEVAATLDAEGKLEGLPFMPEMARLCGTRARVHRHVDKTCVEGGGFRRMATTVLLADLRCDGSYHDGCQRNCLFFWKQAWLKPVEQETRPEDSEPTSAAALANLPTCENGRYLCQSTDLFAASRPMSRWNLTHFFTEIRRGELTLSGFLAIFIGTTFDRLRGLLGFRKVGSPAGSNSRNTRGDLDLGPGEWVEVLSYEKIQATLDPDGKNCGLAFEPSMSEFVGRRFQVERQLKRIILEQSGKMIGLAHTVSLKDVTCQGRCSMNCPRGNDLYWRESWLKRA